MKASKNNTGNYIIVGCDLHEKNMHLTLARNKQKPLDVCFSNDAAGRRRMIAGLKKAAGRDAQVQFAYEASCLGFGLYDQLRQAGIGCHVLAPSKIKRSPKDRQIKNDKNDAHNIFQALRAHLLAGNDLPAVWVPDPELRDDRLVVRRRLDLANKLTAAKTQVQCLLKQNSVRKPREINSTWTQAHRGWLQAITVSKSVGFGARTALASYLREIGHLEEEIKVIDKHIQALAETQRWAEPARALDEIPGVGMLTAMVVLTEIGDFARFANRRRIAAYIGVVPSCHESGNAADRKGHITHRGPARVRGVLCQAVWSAVRTDPATKARYEAIVKRNPKKKKIATVALMRLVIIRMWQAVMRLTHEQQSAPAAA
jgi:transposase